MNFRKNSIALLCLAFAGCSSTIKTLEVTPRVVEVTTPAVKDTAPTSDWKEVPKEDQPTISEIDQLFDKLPEDAHIEGTKIVGHDTIYVTKWYPKKKEVRVYVPEKKQGVTVFDSTKTVIKKESIMVKLGLIFSGILVAVGVGVFLKVRKVI